ncbi:MAG: bifunctional 2-polyprenyl-6-hydroxyphenol methylase/3-demethylubiquinol 3-O-methyltransferase UbiG [Stenotrophobium sp.]
MNSVNVSANVDAGEIAHFEKLAATWWDPRGEMGPLHSINPPRVAYIERCAGGLKGKSALDVGCGGGILTEALAARGANALGIDLADASLKVAERHALESGINAQYRKVAAEELAREKPGSFDLVCCLEMLEHVPQPDQTIAACAALVKAGGDIVFSTINRNPKSYALAIFGAEYVMNLIPRGTHDYAKFIRPSELDRWARAAGLDVVGMRGLRYNPLLKTGSLSDDVDVNYLMHCRKPA